MRWNEEDVNRLGKTYCYDNESDDSEYEDFWSSGAPEDDSKLQSKLSEGNLDKVINTRFVVTESEILFAMVKFTEKYFLPISALEDLSKMINNFVNSPVLRDSHYRFDQLLRSKDGLEYHAYCVECDAYIRQFYPNEKTVICKKCNNNISVKEKNFFVLINVDKELKNLVEKHGEYYISIVNNSERSQVFRDIYDGIKYKEFVKSLSLSERDLFLTCTFNTDGSLPFDYSTYSIWPIQIVANELPQQVRFDNPVTCALWFGRSKPNMEIFLKAFVQNINKINERTIPCKINGILKNIKIYPICCCVDTIARAPAQGLIQFNGRFGCNWCLHPGKSVKSEKKKL
ncbi:uncharacterized protein LOC131664623 [Phymastichus coffea]|uniref:uncharacterized protein LOC131664623 n=1 Tax=Phymastichus coffea TaxID=108790 RepID=UPI00273B5C35|nr:uncharacterized protein LOC131664623 [Phymastichus coffea]